MDIDSLAQALFGSPRAETQEVSTDGTTRTYMGVAMSDSEDGTVVVDLGGDVTLPDDLYDSDGNVVAEWDGVGVEMSTSPQVLEGEDVIVTLVGGSATKVPMVTAVAGAGDRQDERIHAIEADYVKATELEADVADIGFLKADSAVITDIQADTAKVHNLTAQEISAATGYVADLEAGNVTAQDIVTGKATVGELVADHVSVSDFEAEQANIDNLQAATADIATIRANSAKVQNLTAAQLEADHATIGTLDTTYMHANMSNSDVAWIENGTIKNGAIVSAMINDVSANKLTAGTINGSVINVTNLNADNITTGTINGQRIGEGSLSLDKLSEDVYTEAEVNSIVDGLNDRIDGAIETFTGTAVPTLNNSPASAWNTTKLRDEHVGDVYYVVNSQSQQNGYCYRFTKSGSTYSWQLIKDSDVTAALSRLTTAEGKITSIESFDSTVSSFMTNTDSELTSVKSRATSLETRMTDAEGDISEKVDTSTFNTLSQTVDTNTASITSLSSTVSQKADGSTVTALTNRVSTVEQDVDGIETSIGELQTTLSTKADSSTVTTVSNRLNTVSDTVDGHTQTLTSVQNTLSTKADSSTVSTLTTQVNNVSDTVSGHTSQLSSITSTQTTMQSTLDKTVKSSIQLWYSKANTTAPSKPTSKVTSTSTSGNAWRIVVPAYNASYPHYYYCWQYEYVDGTYGWSAVVRDIAMGESQSTARTADSNASTALSTANTANTNASEAKTTATTANTTASEAKTTAETAASDATTAKTNAASAVTTANSASTTATNAQTTANANIKSSVQLWFTKANSTAPSKPTSVVSTSNANTANAWNLVVPVWNSSYPHYYYCYQQQKGDGTYQWTDVVYDRATSEAQQLANTTSTNLTTLQTDYATFKQTTEQFESTVGTTYATKTELSDATDDITELEGRVSTNETSISNNASAIALKANSSDVYTKSGVDGKITQEVSDRNAAITAKANEITSTVSQTYTTKDEFNNLEIGGRNYILDSAGTLVSGLGSAAGSRKEYQPLNVGQSYMDVPHGTQVTISFDLYMTVNTANPTILVYNTNNKGPKAFSRSPAGTGADTGITKSFTATAGSVIDERVSVTGYINDRTSPSHSDNFLEFYSNYGSSNWFSISNLKVEHGNRATDWTPAPEDIESRVSSAESAITQNAQNIELKVSKDGVISSINQSSESVSINAQKINLTGAVTISDLASDTQNATLNSNISVGGRNLFSDSKALSTAKWTFDQEATRGDNLATLAANTSSRIYQMPAKGYWSWKPNTEYVVSVEAKASASGGKMMFNMVGAGGSKKKVFDLTTSWARYSWAFTSDATVSTGSASIYNDTNTGTVQVRLPKLEEGNKATDWSPAPEDVDSAISNAAKTATSYVTEITGQNGIMVHPSTDQTTGVQITDSVNIMQDGVSVAEYGETARVGAEDSSHSVWESGEFVFNDGTNDTMKLSAPESITETHVIPYDNISYYAYIELEYPPASLISVEVDNTEYTYTPTMTPYGLKLWKHGGDGDGFDGETVTITYKPSPAMYIYDGKGDDTSNIAARINANKVSLAKDVFSFSTKYDLSSGSILGGDIRIGDSDESRSEIALSSSSDESSLTFQVRGGNRTAGFILDSGSTSYPDRVLDLIYLDRINYADPYGGSDRQLGKPTRLTASGSYKAGTADTMGPHVTLTAGIWIINGIWNFANSSSNAKRLVIGCYRSSTGDAFTHRIHTTASSNTAHRLEVVDFIVVSAASETVTLYGASSPASTSAATQFITAVRLA